MKTSSIEDNPYIKRTSMGNIVKFVGISNPKPYPRIHVKQSKLQQKKTIKEVSTIKQ